jgi:hypothetical protein
MYSHCHLLHPDVLIVKVGDHLQLNFPFFGLYSCLFGVGRIFMKTKCRTCVIRARPVQVLSVSNVLHGECRFAFS